MSLLRFAGRTMLASFFVVNGAKAVANPEPLVSSAEPLAKAFVPLAQKVAPPTVANYIPEDTRTLVRLTGVAQVLGGLMLATGIGRRLGAGLLGASMIPHVLASRPGKLSTPEERQIAQSQLLRNVALLGGAILASLDTQGKPDLAWLAADRKQRLSASAERATKSLTREARRTADGLSKDAVRTTEDMAKGFGRTARTLRREAAIAKKTVAREAKVAQKAMKRELKLAGAQARLQVQGAQNALGDALS
jgi:uncharacterized membrane protein YphA (DoxX/SURF4 family)